MILVAVAAVTNALQVPADGHVGESLALQQNASSLGMPGDPLHVDRFVQISMNDRVRFEPSSVAVVQGETVEFDVKNDGHVVHEFMLDTEAAIERHNDVMKALPPMVHAGANMITVMPESGAAWSGALPRRARSCMCLQHGHWDAGMMGAVSLTKATT